MKKIIALILTAAALLSLCACGGTPAAGPDGSPGSPGNGSAAAGTAELGSEETEYELKLCAEFLDLPAGMAYASAQCRVGDTVWLGGLAESGAVLGSVTLDGTAGGLIEMPEGCEFVYAMCPAGDGAAVLAGSAPEYYNDAQGKFVENPEPEGRLLLLMFDGTQFVSQTELDERYTDVFNSMLELDGCFYILSQNSLIKLASDGTETARFEQERGFMCVSVCVFDGAPVIASWSFDPFGGQLCTLDAADLSVREKEFIPDIVVSGLGVANGALAVDTGSGVYALDGDFQLGEPVFEWADLFVGGGYQQLEELDGGYLFFNQYQEQVCCARMKETRVRKTVVMATDASYGGASSLASAFNRSQDVYYLQVNVYEFEDAMRLQTEIGAGNWPDLFAFSNKDTLAEMRDDTALENLYDYLDADAELSREDFVPALLRVMEDRGALYWIPYQFWISTMMAPESLISHSGVSVEEVTRVARENGLVPMEQWITREDMLSWCSMAAVQEYVDWDSSSCSFDSEGFVHMLELCGGLYASKDVNDGEIYTGPNDPALLKRFFVQRPSNIAARKENFGEGYCFAGFPETMGNGSILWPQIRLAITAGAQEKAGAWEFIKFASGEEGQNAVDVGMKSNAALMEEELSALVRDGWTDYYGGVHEFSADDARKFRELVDGAEMVVGADPTLEKIISDCAAAYFAGDKSAEDAARDIQARAAIYVAERG